MSTTIHAMALATGLLVAAPALAQRSPRYSDAAESRRSAPTTIIAQHHASTAGEGWLRGWADYLRAQYEGLVQASEARLMNEAAREKAIYNDDLYVRTKHAQRDAKAARQLRHNREVAQRNLRGREVAQAATLASANELLREARYGSYQWPPALRHPAYAEQIADVESLLAGWPEDSGISALDRRALAELARDLRQGVQVENRGGARASERLKALDVVKQLERIATADYADSVKSAWADVDR